jgi:hypothetical protein
MTITVELPPEIEERFLAHARDRGLSLDAYVQEFLARSAEKQLSPKLSPEDLDRMLDEAADLVPSGPPLSDFAMSRESIYTREDERRGRLPSV